MSTPPPTPPASSRIAAIDAMKVLGMLAMFIAHSGPPKTSPDYTQLDFLLRARWTGFAVPLFLLCSGHLYYRATPIGWQEVGVRMSRILVPYLIASVVVQASGLFRPGDASQMLFEIATASSLGIYYYIFLIVLAAPLAWPLSRMSPRVVVAITLLSFVYAIAAIVDRSLSLSTDPFWWTRNPLNFFLGFFLIGWVSAAYREPLAAFGRRHRAVLFVASFAAVAIYFVHYYGPFVGIDVLASPDTRLFAKLYRFEFALGLAALVAIATAGRSVPPWIRFTSDATLTLYLYHRVFQELVLPYTLSWPPLVRIAGLTVFAMAASSLLVIVGRRIFGRSSKLILGA